MEKLEHSMMKLTPELANAIEGALAITKKNGDPVFPESTEFEVKVAGTFAADKFIVIKRKEAREESTPDPNLKQHHS